MRTISSTIDIDAPPEQVWNVLTDAPAHAAWNPFMTQISGELTVGKKIDVRIAPPGGKAMTFHPTITQVEHGRRLEWLGQFVVRGVFDGAHTFTLEPLGEGGTRFTQSEKFSGILAYFSRRLLDKTASGFKTMNEALRDRVASGNTSPLQ